MFALVIFVLSAGGFVVYLKWLNDEIQWTDKLVPADVIFPDGAKYYGETQGGLLQGKGKLVRGDGSVYKGDFEKGLMHGQGTYEETDGLYYKGEYAKGMWNGDGELKYAVGAHYVGEFKDNQIHGSGKYTETNGDTYDGEFEYSLFSGQGSYSLVKNGIYLGTFSKGEITHGIYTDTIGNVYEGSFSDWSFHGKGKYRTEGASSYEGTFVEGELMGKSVVIQEDGAKYEGEVVSWMYEGQGKIVQSNGDVYEGEFRYNDYHGQGILTLKEPKNGISTVSGSWKYGYSKDDPRKAKVDYSEKIEAALYSQNTLLDKTLNTLEPQDPSAIDMYFVGVAGYSRQDVFLKEINFIVSYFTDKKYSLGKTIALINNWKTADTTPLATTTALKSVIGKIENRMDVENDILFLYMTSHGSSDHTFSIQLNGVKLPDIGTEQLSNILSSSEIKWKVIVISACYSGGFVPALENEHTLIMTAAREDRKSFGCSDDSDMTYFARAFFKEALPQENSFVSAFEHAKNLVAQWEETDFPDSKKSEPQISIGDKIEAHLSKWRAQTH